MTEATFPPKRPIKDFTDLEVWQVARQLRNEVYGAAKAPPDAEKHGLASQMRRAATSVTANITEGFGRFSFLENAQVCRQARGSLYELRDHLTTCVDERYLTSVEGHRLEAKAHHVGRLLNGYLRATLAMRKAAVSSARRTVKAEN